MKFAILLGWIFLILAGYYVFHKPVTPAQALALAQAGVDILLPMLVLTAAGALGRRLLHSLELSPLERFTVSGAAGLGIFSLAWLGLGSLGLIYPLTAWLCLLLPLILLRQDALGWWRDAASLGRYWNASCRLEKTLAVGSVLLVSLQLISALAPPLKWDALTYHLYLPQQYIAQHAVRLQLDNPYGGQPQLAEMVFTWAAQLHRLETSAVVAWGAGVVFLIGVLGMTSSLAAELFGNGTGDDSTQSASAGWAAVFAVLVGFTFRRMLGWSYTDLFSGLFGLAMLILALRWLRGGSDTIWLWLGAFGGWLVSVKWPSGVILVGIFIYPLIFRKVRAVPLKFWLAGGGIAAAVYLPWAVRDLLATGNPLYPFAFPTAEFSAWRLSAANLPPEGLPAWMGVTLPVSLSWTGVDSSGGFGTDIGPLLVLLALPAAWIFRRRREVWLLSLVLVLTWLGIAVLGFRYGHLTQPRLYYSALGALAVLAGLGWFWLQGFVYRGIRVRRILAALVCLVGALAVLQDVSDVLAAGAPEVLFGTKTEKAYLEGNLGWYASLDASLASLPAGSHVQALWEPRGLYLPGSVRPDFWIDRWRADLHLLGTPEAVLASWKAHGITHLLIYQAGEEFMREGDRSTTPQTWEAFDRLTSQLTVLKVFGGVYRLYALP